MRLIDLTRQSMGWDNPFQTRTMNQITTIGIHHSATDIGSQMIFENHWRNLGWRNGGYHEIILRNGDVEICYVPTIVTNGVGGHNTNSFHIAAVGNSNFTEAQERSLIERIRFNMNRFQIPIERVLGHNEFPNTPQFNHRANICPGRNMNTLRSHLRLPSHEAPSLPPNHTPNTGDTFIITQATGGFFTAADALAGRNQRTTVQPGNYHVFNRFQGMINVTTRQGIPGSWINPAGQGTFPENIRVGSRVRVNDSAQHWATGQAIPSWVRGRVYIVQQIRNNNDELLLADILSWIRRRDVTLV